MARYDDEEEGIVREGRREPGIYSLAEMPKPAREGVLGRAYETMVEPWVEGYQKYVGRPTQRIVGAAAGAAYRGIVEPLARDIGYIATGKRSFPSTGDLSREVAGKVIAGAQPFGTQDDYATRGEGRIQPQREPQPVVAPQPDLERMWGITREALPTGATKYTLPGEEGVMTVGRETRGPATAAFDEEYARAGVMQAARMGEAERERGIIYREQVEQAKRTQAETDVRLEEEKLQEAAGIIPRRGMAEYEYGAKLMRMTPRERREEAKATGKARETYIAGRAAREAAGVQVEGVVSAAGMKAQTEAAKLGIQAADVKSRIQLRQTQMDKMLTETGLLEPMKLKLQGARDAVARTKIQRDTYESANKQIYNNTIKGLQDKFNIGQIDAVTYDTELNTLTKSFAARQDMIADQYAMEGQVHSSGVAVMKNGIWVDIEKGKIK